MASTQPSSSTSEHARLTASLEKLRKSHHIFLVHSAEYSAFIEELQELPEDASHEDLEAAGRRFGGTLVDEKDVKSVLTSAGVKRGRDAAIQALEERLHYVNDNIEKIQKQIDLGESALYDSGADIGENGVAQTEGGLPIYDIEEEVDDEGNIIKATAKDQQGNIRRIGAKDLPDFEKIIREAEKDTKYAEKKLDAAKVVRAEEDLKQREEKIQTETAPATRPAKTRSVEESQTFPSATAKAQDTPGQRKDETQTAKIFEKVDENILATSPTRSPTHIQNKMEAHDLKDDMVSLQNAGPEGEKNAQNDIDMEDIEEINRSENKIHLPEGWVTTNPNDTDEDAELRRQMLEYQYHEMGPIVAELNIEEDEDDEDWEDETDEDEDEDDEDEDEHGRSTRPFISPKLRAEMAALQARLAAQNLAESIGTPPVPSPSVSEPKSPLDKGKKSVRFNETLDISPAPAPFKKNAKQTPPSPLSPSAPSKSALHKRPGAPTATPAPVALGDPKLDPEEEDTVPFLASLLAQSEDYQKGLIPGLKPPEEEIEPVAVPRKEKKPSLFKASRSGTAAGGILPSNTIPKVESPKPVISDTLMESIPPKAISGNVLERKPPKAVSNSVLEKKPPKVLSEGVVEKTPPKAAGPLNMPPSMSIFRSAEKVEDEPETGNRPLLAPSIIEAKPPVDGSAPPPDPLEPEILRKEAAAELVKLQARFNAREGGFSKEEEEMGERREIPLDEDQGGRKKVSKFKAMRMRGLQ